MTATARPVLTDIELAVLQGSADGRTYAALGRELSLTEKSIGNVAMRVIAKFGAASITHAVLLACRAGILDGQRRRHGDHAGYAAHVYRGEDPKDCPHGCWEAELAYRADRRRARRAQGAPSAPVSATFSASADSRPSGLANASEAHSAASRPKNQTNAA
ncbi:response regulator transcription factor [Streptomyces sp. NPDC001194]|uniref:response regulator transcription factor n=1 Tax=Streptomyces sp. NPDC001194 TaxID=3364547 RepID=UPI0036A59F07